MFGYSVPFFPWLPPVVRKHTVAWWQRAAFGYTFLNAHHSVGLPLTVVCQPKKPCRYPCCGC